MAQEKTKLGSVEVRPSSRTYGETSPTGDSTREEQGYELGVEVDGVWVPFATVGQSQLDHAAQRAEAQQASKASGSNTSAG